MKRNGQEWRSASRDFMVFRSALWFYMKRDIKEMEKNRDGRGKGDETEDEKKREEGKGENEG